MRVCFFGGGLIAESYSGAGNGQPSLRYGHITIDYYPYPYYPAFYRNNGNTTEPGNFTVRPNDSIHALCFMRPLQGILHGVQFGFSWTHLTVQEYTVYFPLTRNTNVNNIRAAGNNVTTIDYLEKPSDCQYNLTSSVASSSISSGTHRWAIIPYINCLQCAQATAKAFTPSTFLPVACRASHYRSIGKVSTLLRTVEHVQQELISATPCSMMLDCRVYRKSDARSPFMLHHPHIST